MDITHPEKQKKKVTFVENPQPEEIKNRYYFCDGCGLQFRRYAYPAQYPQKDKPIYKRMIKRTNNSSARVYCSMHCTWSYVYRTCINDIISQIEQKI